MLVAKRDQQLVAIRVPKAVSEELRRTSDELGESQSSLIRRWIREGLGLEHRADRTRAEHAHV